MALLEPTRGWGRWPWKAGNLDKKGSGRSQGASGLLGEQTGTRNSDLQRCGQGHFGSVLSHVTGKRDVVGMDRPVGSGQVW